MKGSALRKHPIRSIAVLAVLLALGFVAVLATRPSAATRQADSPLLGKRAPFPATRTIDGDRFDLSEMRGQWVLVNFFATWCTPCRVEHPDLLRFSRRHAQIGDASVVSVVYDDDVDSIRDFLKKEGGDWPFVMDSEGKIALDFGVRGVPESYLVAPSGVIAARIVGGVRADQLERLLQQGRRAAQ